MDHMKVVQFRNAFGNASLVGDHYDNPEFSIEDFEGFVRTRHAMWLEKSFGLPASTWLDNTDTLDAMVPYRFTDIWRELDRGTLEVARIQDSFDTTTYKVLHTLLYRFFNSRNGYDRLIQLALECGPPKLTGLVDLTDNQIDSILDLPGNYSGAYIRTIKRTIARNAIREMPVHASRIADLLEDFVCLRNMAGADLYTSASIENVRLSIRKAFGDIPSFGNFLADQLMLDFCGQGNEWGLWFEPALGPGAKRGLERAGMTVAESIIAGQRALAGMPVPKVNNVAVTFGAVEAEHALCEAEKLWKLREAADEGTGRQVKMRKYSAGVMRAESDAVLPPGWTCGI